jgi:positive regulator of sigma E activity
MDSIMGKAWLGYLSSTMMLLAGILMIAGEEIIIGCILIVLSIVSFVLKAYMNKRSRQEKS